MKLDGVWLPDTETHLIEHMRKNRHLVDGIGTYQYKKLAKALSLTTRRGVALDIGAHVGLWSMWLVRQFATVHAFEPVPMMQELFERNVQGATLHKHGLGNVECTVDFQIPLETTGNAHVAIDAKHPGTRGVANPGRVLTVKGVQIKRLDDLGLRGVDFLKCDVEGQEWAVMLGGEQTIRRDRPLIVVEEKGNSTAYGVPHMAAVRLLEKWGARVMAEIGGDYILEFRQ